MKPVIIYEQDTRTIVNHHHRLYGDDYIIVHPYEMGPRVVERDDPNTTWDSGKEEYVHHVTLEVEGLVWTEIKKTGKYLEQIQETTYVHKSIIDEGFRVVDVGFLKPYQNRFLYLTNNTENPRFKKYFIVDVNDSYWLNRKKPVLYEIKLQGFKDFKEFKSKLKELNLL